RWRCCVPRPTSRGRGRRGTGVLVVDGTDLAGAISSCPPAATRPVQSRVLACRPTSGSIGVVLPLVGRSTSAPLRGADRPLLPPCCQRSRNSVLAHEKWTGSGR